MDSLQQRTHDLVKPLIPHDAEERVSRSFKQWNQVVREQIRGATGLKLTDGDGTRSVPVKVVDGFPVKLAELIDSYADPVLWRLIIGQPKLGALVEGAQFLLDAWPQLEGWPKLQTKWRNMERALSRSSEMAQMLQNLAIAEKVRKEIRKITEDLLGAYFIYENRVELYWIPIAMVAAMTDVRIEDMTLVILIHELAHGYTHIGSDIDGRQWETNGFASSDLEVVEGLAQFYTHMIVDSLANRTPGPKQAYQRLLDLQSGPYRVHQKWLEQNPDRIGEIIRLTMVSARGIGKADYATWKQLLKKSGSSLSVLSSAKQRPEKLGKQSDLGLNLEAS